MRILVTGATGFVGSHVARQLVGLGHEVTALVREASDTSRLADVATGMAIVRGDLRDALALRSVVRDARPQACVHLGWFAVPGKYLDAPENLELVAGTLRLVQSLVEAGCTRLVGVGTCFEYDTSVGYLHEDTRLAPRHLYSASKAALQLVLEQTNDMRVSWARLFYLFGPEEHPRRLVPSVILSLLRNELARCTIGSQVRDFLCVEDVASALCAVLFSRHVGTVNIASGAPITVADLVMKIGALMGKQDLVKLGALELDPRDPPFVCGDVRRLRSDIGWAPSYTLDVALQRTINWWSTRAARP
nr:ADP-L-glycero-D-manno-heptose-6-epimerase [uncultured bacterium]